MASCVITVASVLTTSYFLSMFFIDYKEHRYFLASIELSSAIVIITMGVCCAWNFTLNALA